MKCSSTKLAWQRVNLAHKLRAVLEIVQSDRVRIDTSHKRLLNKYCRWEKQLQEIIKKVDFACGKLRKTLEQMLDLSFDDGETLAIALFQPSTRNLFLEIRTQYCSGGNNGMDCKTLDLLAMLSDIAKAFALVGDAAISMAVLHYLWSPEILEVGRLTQKRAELVSNEHLAQVCDKWELYENRIHFDPIVGSKSEIQHDKGTLVEAVYGIVYILYGFEKVREKIVHLLDVDVEVN